jgi:hypothetical protein
VLAYIFKDRIKELLRAFFIRYIPNLVSDRMEDLIDPAIGSKVGVSRARVRFCDALSAEADILRIRNQTTKPFRHVLKPENVIHFQKEIHLNSSLLRRPTPGWNPSLRSSACACPSGSHDSMTRWKCVTKYPTTK